MSIPVLGIIRTTGQPVRVTDGSVAAFGGVIGTTRTAEVTLAGRGASIIRVPDLVNGRDQLLAWSHGTTTIRRSYDGLSGGYMGQFWETAYTFSGIYVPYIVSIQPGFHMVTINGKPQVFLTYYANISPVGWRYLRYAPETNAYSVGSLSGYAGSDSQGRWSILFHNILYTGYSSNIVAIDTALAHSTLTSSAGTHDNVPTFFVYNGALHAVSQESLTPWDTFVLKLTSGTWSLVSTINEGAASTRCSYGVVAEDGTLIVLCSRATGGTTAWSLDPVTYAATDITANLPAGFSALSVEMISVRDRETNGPTGTDRVVLYSFIYTGVIVATRVQSATVFTDLGSFGDADDVQINPAVFGQGEYCYTDAEIPCIITESFVYVGGNMQFKFKAFGGGTYDIELLVAEGSMTDNEYRALLANPSAGSLAETNHKVTGLTADGTEYSVEWDFTTDGQAIGDRIVVRPFAS